jgi:exopolyphosphatase/pppGpp-phosphohydrolase
MLPYRLLNLHTLLHAAGVAGQPPQHICSIPLGCLSIQAGSSTPEAASQRQQQQQQRLLQAADAILATHATQTHLVISTYKQQQLHTATTQQQQQQQQQQQEMSRPVVIGTGGTITTLAALQLQLPSYDHAHVHMSSLSEADVEGLLQQLLLEEGRQRWVGRNMCCSTLCACWVHAVYCML